MEKWVRPKEALEQLGVSPEELITLLRLGLIARPTKLGEGTCGWLQSEIDAAKKRAH